MKQLENSYNQSLKTINDKISKLQFDIDGLNEVYDWLDDGDPEKIKIKSQIQSKIYQKRYQQALQGQVDDILDKLHTQNYTAVNAYLSGCYNDGYIATMYDLHGQGIPLIMPIDQESVVKAVQLDSKISTTLYTRMGENVDALKKSIAAEVSRGIVTGATYAQVAQQIKLKMTGTYNTKGGAYGRALTIARTEGHRIQVQAGMDACIKAKEMGCDVVKQWDSTLDGKTRPSHRAVDGEIRELEKPFSNNLMFPGDSKGKAGEVVNCRCALLQRAKWALDEGELQTLKERAEYYGLNKTENFEDFKEKYLKAVETADNTNDSAKSIGDLTKPKRPRRREFDNEDDYESALEKYRVEKSQYDKRIDDVVENALNRKPAFTTKSEVIEWANKQGISVDDAVLDSIDLRSFDDVKTTLEEMFEKYPHVKSYQLEYFDGSIMESRFRIGLTDDGLLSANGGFNFNKSYFGDYETGLREALSSISTGYLVRADGSFSSLVRHEYGHNVQNYIELNMSMKYHHSVDDWRTHFDTFDDYKKADELYRNERKQYESELISLAGFKGVSEYAQTNTSELFAEGFAEYTSGGKSEFGNAFGEFLGRWYK